MATSPPVLPAMNGKLGTTRYVLGYMETCHNFLIGCACQWEEVSPSKRSFKYFSKGASVKVSLRPAKRPRLEPEPQEAQTLKGPFARPVPFAPEYTPETAAAAGISSEDAGDVPWWSDFGYGGYSVSRFFLRVLERH